MLSARLKLHVSPAFHPISGILKQFMMKKVKVACPKKRRLERRKTRSSLPALRSRTRRKSPARCPSGSSDSRSWSGGALLALPHSIIGMSTTNTGALRTMSHSLVSLPLARGHIFFSKPATPTPALEISSVSARLTVSFDPSLIYSYTLCPCSVSSPPEFNPITPV